MIILAVDTSAKVSSVSIMKDGKLLICDTAEAIKKAAGANSFEQAFIHIVKEAP